MYDLMLPSNGVGGSLYKIVSNLSFSNSKTIDVKDKIPSYSNLTEDNFIICLIGGRSGDYGESGRVIWAGYNPIEKSYDKTSGILTLTGNGPSIMYSGGVYNKGSAIVDIYVAQSIEDVSSK